MKSRSRRRIWIPASALALVIIVVGVWSINKCQGSLEEDLRDDLRTVRDASIVALENWMDGHLATVKGQAERPSILTSARELLAAGDQQVLTREQLLVHPASRALADLLGPVAEARQYLGFAVIAPDGRLLMARDDRVVGLRIPGNQVALLETARRGQPVVSLPMRFEITDQDGRRLRSATSMFALAPLESDGAVIGALGFVLNIDTFTHILGVAQRGESGETYAFDENAVMISNSRFEDQLRRIGLLPNTFEVHSVLNIEIRNPGVDLTSGQKTSTPRRAQPLTTMAASATDGKDGVNTEGYSDYRGVEVVGAWRWLPRFGFGVASEVDYDEAYRHLGAMRTAFRVLLGLLVLSMLATAIYSAISSRLQGRVAAVQQLGQYGLERKIGEGGMGKVYLARHAMLRRPVAVKLISGNAASKEAVARFEREVLLTSQLTHQNTIAIYDYGRTPEGVFYYAMEYLPGINLDELVEMEGPLPEARTIFLLRQICASLEEAHGVGFIHRDIKPANIILCERGGLSDVVKVLDFGLVKELSQRDRPDVTAPGMVAGTPEYIAPEALRDPTRVGPASDLYAVGCVGYYLLAGDVVFDASSVFEVCDMQINSTPPPIAERRGNPLNERLEAIVMRLLQKDPRERFECARDLRLALRDLVREDSSLEWGEEDARGWWQQHGESVKRHREDSQRTPTGAPDSARSATLQIDFDSRVD